MILLLAFDTFGIPSLHILKQCGMDDKSSLRHQKNNAAVTNATKMTFVLTILAQRIAHELLPVVCITIVGKLGTMLNITGLVIARNDHMLIMMVNRFEF